MAELVSDPRDPDKLFYEMRVLAQDPSVKGLDGNPLLARVLVPADRLEAGPRGHRVRVIDFDASTGVLGDPAPVNDGGADGWGWVDPFPGDSYRKSLLTGSGVRGRNFRAQNVYAIVARTLARFEFALGRRIPWGFGTHELYAVPHAFNDANAYYSRDDHALYFGYFLDSHGDTVFTSLSHDIIAHETSHALLDGLRPGLMHPGLPDQPAFHEGLADVVALLSILSMEEVVAKLLGAEDDEGRISTSALDKKSLKENALLRLAEEFGEALTDTRGVALRESVRLKPNRRWRRDRSFEAPHRRGEILVAAILQTLLDIWVRRLDDMTRGRETVSRRFVAEEGAKAAEHLLTMAIRAIDYLPPTDFEFEDFVTALVTADVEAAPHDEHGYRDSLVDAFKGFDIVSDGSAMTVLAASGEQPLYAKLNFGAMRSQPDEIYRFVWANADLLKVASEHYLDVGEVRPSLRVGPDGLVVNEIVATYQQRVAGPIEDMVRLRDGSGRTGLRRYGLADGTQVALRGGGVLIFDQFGKLKYHHAKPLLDWERQNSRLAYLVRRRIRNTSGGYGFSSGTRRGQRFADLHLPAATSEETW